MFTSISETELYDCPEALLFVVGLGPENMNFLKKHVFMGSGIK